MSGRIIPLREPGCAETQELMPWLISGALSPVEEARTRAHIAGCAACQGELAVEKRLREEVVGRSTQTDLAWRAFRPKLETRRSAGSPRAWVGWAIAAQFLLLVGGAAILKAPPFHPARPATFHTLGSSAAPASANILVMFRPETTEAGMRSALRAAGARLVDGPTEANAYLLTVPAPARASSLTTLSKRPEVTLVQPIDSGSSP